MSPVETVLTIAILGVSAIVGTLGAVDYFRNHRDERGRSQ